VRDLGGDDIPPVLTSLTGQDWRYVVPTEVSHWAHIALGDGEDAPGVTIQYSDRDKKLIVTGAFPRGDRGDYGPYRKHQPVGISPTKPAEAIARDIARRLLPDYLPAHAVAVESKQRDVEAHGKGLMTAQVLGVILGDEPGDSNAGGWKLIRYGTPNICVEVDDHQDDRRVKITLDNLTQAEAKAVLAVVPKGTAQEEDQ